MANDPLSKLGATIAASARDRDLRDKQVREDLAAKDRQREGAKSIWAERRLELPRIVETVDGMLKTHGFGGLAMAPFDLKHADLDRILVEFEHSVRNHSKILLCVTRAGDFTCTISATSGEVHATTVPMAELTADRLQDVVADAVGECLTGAWAPRSERFQRGAEVVR